MARPRTAFEDAVAHEFARQLPIRARAMAQMQGPAPGSQYVTGQEELDYWDEVDESVDVINEYAMAVGQGMDDATAQAAVTLRRYPRRAEMMESAAPSDPKGQAAYARTMRQKSEQRRSETQPQEADDVSGSIY